jgi:MFS family permease
MFAVVREIRCPCIGPVRGLHSLLSISRFFALQLPVVTMLVETTIENAKFGWYQIYTLLVVWGSLFADGGEMLCISLISKEMGTSFKWKNQSEVSHYVGILGSLTFFGFLLGSLYGGKLIDIFGRRNPFILFNLTTFVFGMASSFSPTVWYLALCRFFTGMGVGGSIPCATAVLAEICPNKERRVVILTKTIGFVLGEILLGFEAQYILPTFKDPDRAWRTLLIVASLPAFVALLLSIFFLDESPLFLEINIARG